MNLTKIYIAANLAQWATILDHAKTDNPFLFPAQVNVQAQECVEKMHLMAYVLAGVQANEIYADTSGFEESMQSDSNFTNAESTRSS